LEEFKNKIVNSENVTEGVKVEVRTKQVATDLKIVVEYGRDIPEIVENIKTLISQEVARMTHLEVVEVNTHVVDIKTHGEFEKEAVNVTDLESVAGQAILEFGSDQTIIDVVN